MDDLKNIRISVEADEVIDKLKEIYYFPTTVSAIQFGMAYALRNYGDKIDYLALEKEYPSNGTNLNVGSVDDGFLKDIILAIFPNCETPYRVVRAAAIYGLMEIDDKLQKSPQTPLVEFMK